MNVENQSTQRCERSWHPSYNYISELNYSKCLFECWKAKQELSYLKCLFECWKEKQAKMQAKWAYELQLDFWTELFEMFRSKARTELCQMFIWMLKSKACEDACKASIWATHPAVKFKNYHFNSCIWATITLVVCSPKASNMTAK